MLPLPPPKIPPTFFPLHFPLEPGTRNPPLHGGRVESSPSQASTSPAGIPTSHAWVESDMGCQDAERNSKSSTHTTGSPHKLAQLGAERITYPRNISAWRRNNNPTRDSPHFNEPFQQLPASNAMPVVSLLYAANARSVWIDESHVGPFFKPPGDTVTRWPNGGHCCEVGRNINAHPNHDFVLQAGLAT